MPSAGGAAATAVPEALPDGGEGELPLLVADALSEKGEAVENAEGTAEPEAEPEINEALADWLAIEAVDPVEEADRDAADDAALAAAVEVVATELDDEEVSGKMVWIRISWHCAPMYSSYRLPNAPLMHLHQRVEPPRASEPFLHTEKPPV